MKFESTCYGNVSWVSANVPSSRAALPVAIRPSLEPQTSLGLCVSNLSDFNAIARIASPSRLLLRQSNIGIVHLSG